MHLFRALEVHRANPERLLQEYYRNCETIVADVTS